MSIKILYIDDEIEERDAQKIQKLLNAPGELECDLKSPPLPKRFPEFIANLPDALLIDLDLNTAVIEGENITYFGSTLASEVRRRRPNCPIILITKPNIIAANPEQMQLLEESIDVDLILDKDEVYKHPNEITRKIISLISGFEELETITGKEWEQVINLMLANEDEADLLREAAPPLERRKWTVPQASRWIRNVVMGYPGILYDELTAATRLGIDLSSFRSTAMQKLIEPAMYTGVFNKYTKRWWRNRLLHIAQGLVLNHGLDGPVAHEFGAAFSKEFSEQLKPAVCTYDKTPIADWVCYLLNEPVKLKNSVPYYPDSRPSIMDQARVSFKAIQESEDFDEDLVDADSFEIVGELWGIS